MIICVIGPISVQKIRIRFTSKLVVTSPQISGVITPSFSQYHPQFWFLFA